MIDIFAFRLYPTLLILVRSCGAYTPTLLISVRCRGVTSTLLIPVRGRGVYTPTLLILVQDRGVCSLVNRETVLE